MFALHAIIIVFSPTRSKFPSRIFQSNLRSIGTAVVLCYSTLEDENSRWLKIRLQRGAKWMKIWQLSLLQFPRGFFSPLKVDQTSRANKRVGIRLWEREIKKEQTRYLKSHYHRYFSHPSLLIFLDFMIFAQRFTTGRTLVYFPPRSKAQWSNSISFEMYPKLNS